MEKRIITNLVDKYEYALAQSISMTVEQRLLADKILADMVAETIELAATELEKKGLLKDE